jgi:hypothetical protein
MKWEIAVEVFQWLEPDIVRQSPYGQDAGCLADGGLEIKQENKCT